VTLTDEQERVVASLGNIFVCACPGAGKTRTLVDLAARSAAAAPRYGVAFLSFTNAAGDEVRQRLVGAAPALLRPPSYVGTFDAFLIHHVLGPDGHQRARGVRVQFRDSWDKRIGFNVVRSGVPLDVFVPDGTTLRIEAERAGDDWPARTALKKLDAKATLKLIDIAKKEVANRLAQGIVTSPFLRSEAERRLSDCDTRERLAARFQLVLIDEAQDCDPLDLRIVAALRDAGCRCVIVADPEQGIFRWRGADPAQLATLGFAELLLTGNFRSTEQICRATASLRARDGEPDRALGPAAIFETPVYVITYPDGRSIADAGRAFLALLASHDADVHHSIVIAHREATALGAVGTKTAGPGSTAQGAIMARAVCPTAGADDRRAALEVLEDVLARALAAPASDRSLDRWRRFTARQVLGVLAASPPGGAAICARVRSVLGALAPPPSASFALSPDKCFKAREPKDAAAPPELAPLRTSTIHGIKGREFDAVLVVLPDEPRLEELVAAWRERNASHEGRAVLYVGATRARRLLAFAVPARATDQVVMLLRRQSAPVEVIVADASTPGGASP
jgi:DNA helicase II / ATP-dependent DNA helicase PcrA